MKLTDFLNSIELPTPPIVEHFIFLDDKGRVVDVRNTIEMADKLTKDSTMLFGLPVTAIIYLIQQYKIAGGEVPATTEEVKKFFADRKVVQS